MSDFLRLLEVQPQLVEDNKLACQFENGSRIVSLPGKEATVRGFSGADLIIEDEAARVLDDLYYSIRPMLAVSGGRLILMSTPFGKRGHFFEEWENGGGGWLGASGGHRREVPTNHVRVPGGGAGQHRRLVVSARVRMRVRGDG